MRKSSFPGRLDGAGKKAKPDDGISEIAAAHQQIDELLRDYRELQKRYDEAFAGVSADKVACIEAQTLALESQLRAQEVQRRSYLTLIAYLARLIPEAYDSIKDRFDADQYLRAHGDIFAAVTDGALRDPFHHWIHRGIVEGRVAVFWSDHPGRRPNGQAD
jgi:hypothetical protein